MTSFRNGPARNARIHLRRTPVLLRVVEKDGTFKGLVGPDDKPKPDDIVHVYLMVQQGGGYMPQETIEHLDAGTKPPRGWHISAEYELYEGDPPPEEALRGVIAWRQWCIQTNPGNPHT